MRNRGRRLVADAASSRVSGISLDGVASPPRDGEWSFPPSWVNFLQKEANLTLKTPRWVIGSEIQSYSTGGDSRRGWPSER